MLTNDALVDYDGNLLLVDGEAGCPLPQHKVTTSASVGGWFGKAGVSFNLGSKHLARDCPRRAVVCPRCRQNRAREECTPYNGICPECVEAMFND